MEHTMRLDPSPFRMIKEGTKTIELRLYDEKRRRIGIGDTIRFVNAKNSCEELRTVVEELHIYRSFKELYEDLPLRELGYAPDEMKSVSPEDMNRYYSPEQQERYGVVGIRIARIG